MFPTILINGRYNAVYFLLAVRYSIISCSYIIILNVTVYCFWFLAIPLENTVKWHLSIEYQLSNSYAVKFWLYVQKTKAWFAAMLRYRSFLY